jgi:hypothetical protein
MEDYAGMMSTREKLFHPPELSGNPISRTLGSKARRTGEK